MLTCSTIYSLIKNFYLRIYISAKETKYLSHFQHTFEATFLILNYIKALQTILFSNLPERI